MLAPTAGTAIVDPADHDGSDFWPERLNDISSEVTIAIGDQTTTVTLEIVNDLLNEPDETVILTLVTPNRGILGGIATTTVTILRDENDCE